MDVFAVFYVFYELFLEHRHLTIFNELLESGLPFVSKLTGFGGVLLLLEQPVEDETGGLEVWDGDLVSGSGCWFHKCP